MSSPDDAAEITRASKSNLALAFFSLSRERQLDMQTFYAFCRVVDDIADSPTLPVAEKERRIQLWREALSDPLAGEPPLARAVRELMQRYEIQRIYFEEIITGVAMDVVPRRYPTFEDLREYCYRVASAVGLVSIEIFGYRNLACRDYALDLGLALQLTNIIRDVGEDFANGRRIYLPMEDLAKFGCTPGDLAAGICDERFVALMNFETERALSFYAKARAELPREDRRTMLPAEIMREVYARLLAKIRKEEFRVFEKKFRLTRPEKIRAILAAVGSVYF